MKRRRETDNHGTTSLAVADVELFRELVAHLRHKRAPLRQEWIRRIRHARLLAAMSMQEIFSETTAIYDNYVKVLRTGSVRDLQAYARDLSRRIIHRGVEIQEVLGIVLLLRDVLARSLFVKYQRNSELMNRVFDVYEPAANRIANTVAVSFVEQRERVIRRQQRAIQVLHVQEEERKRISRELHDEIGQALTALLTDLAVFGRNHSAGPDSLAKMRIADIQTHLVGAMERVHSFARELRPAMLDDVGLLPALRSYLKDYAERTGLLVRFERGVQDAPLNADQKTTLFRVAQESLNNIAKHAHATEVEVSLRVVKNGVQLRIRDNGKGFAVDEQRSVVERSRLGLLGMQERVGLMSGRFLVQSTPGKGTTIIAEIPVLSADQAGAA